MEATDLSPEIKKFAAENEAEIKAVVQQMIMEFYESSISQNYEEKWDAGVKEHNGFNEEVLMTKNWVAELGNEFMDAFWYQTIILFRQRRAQDEK